MKAFGFVGTVVFDLDRRIIIDQDGQEQDEHIYRDEPHIENAARHEQQDLSLCSFQEIEKKKEDAEKYEEYDRVKQHAGSTWSDKNNCFWPFCINK